MTLFARLFRSKPGRDLRAARAGDRAAIERFYDAHVDGLYAFVFHRVGRDAALAQDFAAMADLPLPGEVLERAETRELVHMAIANLPDSHRVALTRKYVDGE